MGSQIPEIEKIDGQMKVESADLHGKDLTESEDHFTVIDAILSENHVILTVNNFNLQVELYDDKEVLIEYTVANAVPFTDVVDCVVNNGKVHLTKKIWHFKIWHFLIPKLKIGLHNKTNG